MIRNLFNKISKEIVHRNLSGVSKGTLIITEGKQKYRFGFDSSLIVEITVNNPSFYSEVLLGVLSGQVKHLFISHGPQET